MRQPTVLSLDDVSARSKPGYHVARLIDRQSCGSELLMGVEWFPVGMTTSWSFETEDDGKGEWFGERDEAYFVLSGRLRLSWAAGESVEFGAGDAVHIPPGRRYTMESIGGETARVVYAITPSL